MVLIEGEYCPEVEHECVRWLDDEKLPFARCGVYSPASKCKGGRIEKRYCIDRFEHAEDPKTHLPLNHQSFTKANRVCKAMGKRLCSESEWNFACEGEQMMPYPYGRARRPVCNQDRDDLFEENPKRRVLRDLRWANAENECRSPFGVYNMVGNLDEPTLLEGRQQGYPFRNALKGGWWMAGRNRCRPATTAHDEHYGDIQIGIRCCRDADPAPG
jgi:formylglycine-generating enzyme required for sulfatase activity